MQRQLHALMGIAGITGRSTVSKAYSWTSHADLHPGSLRGWPGSELERSLPFSLYPCPILTAWRHARKPTCPISRTSSSTRVPQNLSIHVSDQLKPSCEICIHVSFHTYWDPNMDPAYYIPFNREHGELQNGTLNHDQALYGKVTVTQGAHRPQTSMLSCVSVNLAFWHMLKQGLACGPLLTLT